MELRDFEWIDREDFLFEMTYVDDINCVVGHIMRRMRHPKRAGLKKIKGIESLAPEVKDELKEKWTAEIAEIEKQLREFGDRVNSLKANKETKEMVSFFYQAPAYNYSIKVYPNKYFLKHWKMKRYWKKWERDNH